MTTLDYYKTFPINIWGNIGTQMIPRTHLELEEVRLNRHRW